MSSSFCRRQSSTTPYPGDRKTGTVLSGAESSAGDLLADMYILDASAVLPLAKTGTKGGRRSMRPLREGIKKNRLFLGKSPKLWVGGGQES